MKIIRFYFFGVILLTVGLLAEMVQSSDAQFQLQYGKIHINSEVANGLGAVHDDGPYLFVAQPDKGASLSDWGNFYEFKLLVPYEVSLFSRSFQPYMKARYEKVSAHSDQLVKPFGWSNNGNFIDFLPIDGSTSPSFFGLNTPDDQYGIRYDIDQRRVSANIGLSTRLNPHERLEFSLYYSRHRTKLKSSIYYPNDPLYSSNLDEKITGYSIGPSIGYAVETEIAHSMSLYGTANFSLLYTHAKLDAKQLIVTETYAVRDSDHAWTIQSDVELGLNYYLTKKAVLSFYGKAGWRGDHYRIVNPRSGPGLYADNSASYHPDPAHLERKGEKTFAFGVKFSYRF